MPAGFYDGKPKDYGVAESGEAIQKTVAAIGGIFQERYQQKQYQDFLDGPQKEYENTLHAASDLLLDETNDEGPSQAIKMMGTGLSKYMDEAGRYRNNPYIADRAHAAFVGNNTMLQQLFTSRMGMDKDAQNKQKMGMDAAKTASELQYQGAQTGLLQAQTKAIGDGTIGVGPTGKLTKGAGKGKGASGPAFLTGQVDPSLPPDQQVAQAYANASGNLTNPGSAAAQKAQLDEMAQIRRSLAQQAVGERQARGEKRDLFDPTTDTTKQEPWDPTNEKHVAEAEKTLVDPEDVKNRYIYSKMLEEAPATMPNVTPDLIQKQYGWMKDPDLANPNAPVTREMSEPNVGKILLGSDGWGKLANPTTKKQPVDLTEAANNLPPDVGDLEGPMRKGVDAVMGGIASGTFKPQSTEEVKTIMQTALRAVVGEYIGGGHPNAKVAEGVLRSRYAGTKFADAVAAKYAQSIAEKLGIVKAAAPKEQEGLNITNKALREYTPVGDFEDIVGGIAGAGSSLLKKLRE